MKRLGIIGGGAAGLSCAVEAARLLRDAGADAQVVVLEADERVGRSILATGNGRCNFSNAHIDDSRYRHAAFVANASGALDRIGGAQGEADGLEPDPVHAFFERLGLMWREESEGRQYPLANKASVVVDVLRAEAARLGVVEACGRAVRAIEPPREAGKPFTLRMEDGAFERFDAVVVACGGRAVEKLASGCASLSPFVEMRPVLGPLKVDSPYPRMLDNIRVRCSVTLVPGDGQSERAATVERGELMFRKYGVSGIAVFNLSRFAQPGDTLLVNFLGGDACLGEEPTCAAVRHLLARRVDRLIRNFGNNVCPTCEDVLRGLVLPRVAEVLCKAAGASLGKPAVAPELDALAEALTAFPLTVQGVADADMCQVRRGGIDVEALDAHTMQLAKTPGLFAAGEAVDVDGPCGGYNLHWAWTSGLLAARAAAAYVRE